MRRPPPASAWSRTKACAALPTAVAAAAAAWGVSATEVLGGSRYLEGAHARAAVSALAVAHLGLPAAAVARTLSVTPAVVLRGLQRRPDRFAAQRLDPRRLCADVMEKV